MNMKTVYSISVSTMENVQLDSHLNNKQNSPFLYNSIVKRVKRSLSEHKIYDHKVILKRFCKKKLINRGKIYKEYFM